MIKTYKSLNVLRYFLGNPNFYLMIVKLTFQMVASKTYAHEHRILCIKNYTSKYIQFLFYKKIHLKKLGSDNNIFDDDAPLLSGSS